MNIKIDPEFPKAASQGLTEIAVVLSEWFGTSTQDVQLADAEEVSHGPLVLPFVHYKEHKLRIETNKNLKYGRIVALLVAHSKELDDDNPCPRMVHWHRTSERDVTLKQIPQSIRDASFDREGDKSVMVLLDTLASIASDRVRLFYSQCVCEGTTTHSFAVVHEYGVEDNPYCVINSYFNLTHTGK